MKFTLICLSVFVAAASTAPQFPFFPAIGSPLLPVQPCAQDELGRLIPPGGLVYPGPVQDNIQIGSWPWGPMGVTPFYPTDPRFLVLPGTGYPVAPTVTNVIKPTVPVSPVVTSKVIKPTVPVSPAVTSKVIKPTVPVTQPITSDDNSKLKPIIKEVPKPVAPVAPVQPTPAKELKPKELTSSTPTVAERSRCLQVYRSYRSTNYEIPEGVQFMVGSDIAYQNQFPFLVGLLREKEVADGYELSRCGASLISPTKILTAAHCVTIGKTKRVRPTSEFQALLGMQFWNNTDNDAQQKRNIIKIKIHEGYYTDDYITKNDVAVLTMDKPVRYTDTISPVCLAPNCLNDENEQEVTAMGWGDTKFNGSASDYLRSAEFTTVPNDKCRETHSNLIDSQMLCSYREGKDTCQGDSGGPLVIDVNKGRQSGFENSCRFMQVGIVSYGDGCAKIGSPSIYARVKNYLPWILKNSK